MILLHNIGERINSNYNTLEEILAQNEDLSFDGVYTSVYKHRFRLGDWKRKTGKRVILFVGGNTVGGDNSFEPSMPREYFCDWDQLFDMSLHFGFEIGWHTWTHLNLCALPDEMVIKEITPPEGMDMASFAYPYGNCCQRVAQLVKDAGFTEAWSVREGDGSQFQKHRRYLNW